MKKILVLAVASVALAGAANAASITPGDLLVYRVGSGTGSLINTGNPVFVDEYTTAGSLVQSIPMPTASDGTNLPLIAYGTSSAEGMLNLSTDGNYLLLTGYGTTTGGATVLSATTSAAVPRVIGRVDMNGNVNTTTALTDFASAGNPRGVASTNGTDIWVAGSNSGVRYTTIGSTTSTSVSTTVTNLRVVGIHGGQLYASDSSGAAVRLGSIGVGLPTMAGQTDNNLPGFPVTGSPYGFVFADLDGTPGMDTVYVADDTATTGGIQKYSLVGGNWTLNGTITAATSVRGLTATVNGTTVSLYGTTGGTAAGGGGTIYGLTDTAGYNAAINGTVTTVATLANTSNEAFRGIAIAVPEPTSLGLIGVAAVLMARRQRKA